MRLTISRHAPTPATTAPTGSLPMLGAGLRVILLVGFTSLAFACGPGAEEGTPGGEEAAGEAALGERVENESLGIALTGVPAGFAVETNEGEELVLVRTEDEGRLSFEMTPIQTAGVNLQARVWEEKERIEALPGGEYRGQNELGGVALGTTYTSRGRFENESGEPVEEYRALLVHPTENRALIIDYEYPVPPPGTQGNERLEHLMLVLEQVEPLAGGGTEAPAEDGGETSPSP